MDYADVECILLEERWNEQGQIGWRGGMQFLLCNGIRIFIEAFQTIESGIQSI